MHIFFVTQYDPLNPAAGGPVYKVRALSDHLARRGHSVAIIAAAAGKHFTNDNQLHVREMDGRVNVIRLRTLCRYRAVTINPAVWLVARREMPRADVVHLLGFYDLLGPVVARVARAHHVPYVLEPMGMLTPIIRSLRKKRLYHRWLGRRLVEGAARVVATSSQEKAELIRAGISASSIVVRRNGIELTEFSAFPERGRLRLRLGIEPDERVLLYLSRISPKKNPVMLLRAFAELNLPDTRLVVAGPDENGYLKQLERLGTSLGLDRKVFFTGPLYGEDKLSALVDSDLFVLPSNNENFGNVIGEAIAAGTPVVITDQCGIAPFVRDRAGLVVPVEQSAISDAIATLLTDAEMYKTFTDGCKDVVKGLSWEQPVEQMETLYASPTARN